MKKHSFLLLVLTLFLTACEEVFEYHPNQIRLNDSELGLTARNVEKIRQQNPDDTVRIVVMGDTQRFYDSAEKFVKAANKLKNIDFVMHQGDISDFGMTQEFRWVHDIMKNLRFPYLTVIGNHDLLANGKKVYQQMYGDLNYSFVYGQVKFIFLDTNGREYDFNGIVPDITWLQAQLAHTPESDWQQAVIVSHMSPFGGDYDSRLSIPFQQTLEQSGRVHLSLHGHEHNWQTIEQEASDITYHITTSTNNRGFSYVEIWNGGFRIKRIHY
ncbi:metallophosphoesterase [Pontibacter korlensis]|uniref:Metallophosphoesterase n=1 Tax=Pontibacter korlensis TaxID=400092 RepID=A0A0E3UY85_9BACT|nr:metallophosphoesterase [Pontibacter korlensis]AKD04231.1 metallophosphoesterase [Pontibacter korlensis]